MDNVAQVTDPQDEMTRLLAGILRMSDRIERAARSSSMRFGNVMLFIIAVAMCAIAYFSYVEYTENQAQQAARQLNEQELELMRLERALFIQSASKIIGLELGFIEGSYSDVVYDGSENRGIYHQIFRVDEYQYELLKMIVYQNQLLLASQIDDVNVMKETFDGLDQYNY